MESVRQNWLAADGVGPAAARCGYAVRDDDDTQTITMDHGP